MEDGLFVVFSISVLTDLLTLLFTSMLQSQATDFFQSPFAYKPSVVAFAPGIINLLGCQVNGGDGRVCSLATHLGTMVVGSMAAGNVQSLLHFYVEMSCYYGKLRGC